MPPGSVVLPSVTTFLNALPLATLTIGVLALVELSKAARWRALFGRLRPAYPECLRALVVGQLTNALSPVRAGEVVRLGMLGTRPDTLVAGTAALAGAKAVDIVCLAAIGLAVAGTAIFSHGRLGLAIGILVIAAGTVLALAGPTVRRYLESSSLLRKLRAPALLDAAEAARDPRILLTLVFATCVVWAAGLAANAVVLAATGTPPSLDLAARMIVAGYLVGVVPAPPARLGVFETAITVSLTSGGVPLAPAIAAAVLLHACQLVELGALTAATLLAHRLKRPALSL